MKIHKRINIPSINYLLGADYLSGADYLPGADYLLGTDSYTIGSMEVTFARKQ